MRGLISLGYSRGEADIACKTLAFISTSATGNALISFQRLDKKTSRIKRVKFAQMLFKMAMIVSVCRKKNSPVL